MRIIDVSNTTIRAALIGIVYLSLAGCGGRIYPVTSGFHAPGETFMSGYDVNGRRVPAKPETVVICAKDAAVEYHLAGVLLREGYTVVERARLQRILTEQNLRISLAGSADQLTEEILRAGKLAGATQVIFVEVQRELSGLSMSQEVRSASASVRGVSVETGQVRWSGTARVRADGIFVLRDAQEGELAWAAMLRATCPVETGNFEWIEPSESDYAGGCRQRGQRAR